ncbi:MAG: UvrD-helicase domain-containing protein [Lachnospiraceae bacterium]|nr:UvrD-helicase domain-containing protein [Lachnospiraceae bacterium]
MIDPRILEKLNEKQREAVLATEGYVRVIAGAGSGKTKLLVSRYAYLVKEYGIDSANILCVTFTNKAAGEMKKRIRSLIGEGNDTTLICTYHGFCNRLLRENSEKLFLSRQFQIMDTAQQKAVLSEIYQKYELKLDYASFESMLHKLGQFKSDLGYVARICDPKPCQIVEPIEDLDDKIMEEFLQRQKATFSLDFHDLIAFAIYALEQFEDIRKKWQERLNYIMVDEFQDSSGLEMKLIEILSARYTNLMIVGDPDQNIYEWRGSDVKLLVEFDKDHVPTNTIFLNQNYRSTPQILKCANTLIEKNKMRLEKDLFTKNPNGPEVVHYHSKDDFEEMDHVIENIRYLYQTNGYKYSDFAILYRSSFLSRMAEKKLVERNIPYEIFGGVKFYQRMEILDILAYLKLIAFDDDMSFKRIVNTPRRRFGRAKQIHLENIRSGGAAGREQYSLFDAQEVQSDESDQSAMSLFETLSSHSADKVFANAEIEGFLNLIKDMRKRMAQLRISEIVNEVTIVSGYEEYIRELGDEERLDNLAEFKRLSNEFEREFGENLTLPEFLQQIALQSGENEESSKDTVKLMTIHSSKGLEFPAVFILGFTEGVFPSSKTMEERKAMGLEEERRLCYVAITRAIRHLFLMDSEGLSPKGVKKLCSRFLEEIGTENYRRIGKISDDLYWESRNYTQKLDRQMDKEEPSSERHTGDRVEHHIFGLGVIQEIDQKRNSYVIKFDSMEYPRSISASYFEEARPSGAQQNSPAMVPAEVPDPGTEVFNGEKVIPKELSVPVKEDAGVSEETIDPGVESAKYEVILPEIGEEGTEHAEAPVEEERSYDDYDYDDDQGYFYRELDEYGFEEADMEDDSEEDTQAGVGLIIQSVEIKKEEQFTVEEETTELTIEEFEADPTVEDRIKEEVRERMKDCPNLWKRDDVPHTGWQCVGVTDLGAPVGICEMCGHQIIRYAHQMEHPHYRSLICGCVCAGRMEGNIDAARQREADLKNAQARRVKFFKRKWKRSAKGNEYLKIDGHIIVIYDVAGKDLRKPSAWKYSIDKEFSKGTYDSRERAMAAVFDALEKIRNK